jgi:hypothetical protein
VTRPFKQWIGTNDEAGNNDEDGDAAVYSFKFIVLSSMKSDGLAFCLFTINFLSSSASQFILETSGLSSGSSILEDSKKFKFISYMVHSGLN